MRLMKFVICILMTLESLIYKSITGLAIKSMISKREHFILILESQLIVI